MASMIGFNIEGNDLDTRRNLIINELKSYTANWHLCLGDEALAVDLLNHTSKGVIYRIFDPFNEYRGGQNRTFDGEVWQKHSAQEIVDYVKVHCNHLLQYKNLVFSIGNNEPSTQGKTSAFVKWCVELAEAGFKAGIRFAIAEIASAKSVNHDEIKAGIWDNFIRIMSVYRGFHIVTFHEYTTGILPATFLPDYPLNLDKPHVLTQFNWHNARMNLSSIDGNWHLGRGALITHVRAKQIGIVPLPFVITECAFDWMDDIVSTPQRAETLSRLKNAYKMPNHDFMRGSTGHRSYHEWLMKETGFTGTWNEYLFAQYQWLVSAYPDECEGFTIFALNHDWDIPEGHDMSNARNDQFRSLVVSTPLPQANAQPIPDNHYDRYDVPMDAAMVNTTLSLWNIRNQPTTNGADIGDMPTTPTEATVSKSWVAQDTRYDWYKISVNGIQGFTAQYRGESTPNVFTPIVVSPPDNGDTDPPPDTSPPTQEQLAQLVAEYMATLTETVTIDIPFPNFTYSTTRMNLETEKQLWRILHNMSGVILDRLENPTPTLSQIANEIYSTATAQIANEHTTTFADGDDMLLDTMLNGEDDNAA